MPVLRDTKMRPSGANANCVGPPPGPAARPDRIVLVLNPLGSPLAAGTATAEPESGAAAAFVAVVAAGWFVAAVAGRPAASTPDSATAHTMLETVSTPRRAAKTDTR